MWKVQSRGKFSKISQFDLLQGNLLGKGSFGTVHLARHRRTCASYALKRIDLSKMENDIEMRMVQREVRLHSELDHPHIIKLWDTFLQGSILYMVMEYAQKGTLFRHQNLNQQFTETEAFKYFTQTLAAVKYLQEHNIVHRDLKPENLLLDANYNIKVCDFGWGAENITSVRTIFCGTYEYMAPEMLFNSHYDYKVDNWALGILLFQLLHGHAPYSGQTAPEVQKSMLKGIPILSQSPSLNSLITQLLQFNPSLRISLECVLQHPWIIRMENLLNYPLDQNIHFINTQIPFNKKYIKHRKNNSVDFGEASKNIHINLQINNFTGNKKSKNQGIKSQQKILNIDQKLQNNDWDGKSSLIKRAKIKQSNMSKNKKKINQMHQSVQQPLDKKLKTRKSQDNHVEKLVRFHTEASDKNDWEPGIKFTKPQRNKISFLKNSIKMK